MRRIIYIYIPTLPSLALTLTPLEVCVHAHSNIPTVHENDGKSTKQRIISLVLDVTLSEGSVER